MRKRVAPWTVLSIYFLIPLAGLFSCAPDEICYTENGTEVGILFRRIIYPDTDSAFVQNDTLIFEQVTALNTDSIFIQSDTLTGMALPLNTGSDNTTFIFDTELGSYTLDLKYQRIQRLISVACGPEQVFDQLQAGPSTFDSLAVVLSSLTDPPQTNVEIYR